MWNVQHSNSLWHQTIYPIKPANTTITYCSFEHWGDHAASLLAVTLMFGSASTESIFNDLVLRSHQFETVRAGELTLWASCYAALVLFTYALEARVLGGLLKISPWWTSDTCGLYMQNTLVYQTYTSWSKVSAYSKVTSWYCCYFSFNLPVMFIPHFPFYFPCWHPEIGCSGGSGGKSGNGCW